MIIIPTILEKEFLKAEEKIRLVKDLSTWIQIDVIDGFVKMVKDEGLEAGLAFDINTPIDSNIPAETDVVLLMARKAGFGDYKFDEKVYEKIGALKKIKQEKDLHFSIGIDGGI